MFIKFNQAGICVFPFYVAGVRRYTENLNDYQQKILSELNKRSDLGEDDEKILNDYIDAFRKSKNDDFSEGSVFPVFPIFLLPCKDGLKYISCNPEGTKQEGFISNKDLGFQIDFEKTEKEVTNLLKEKLPKILEITSEKGDTIPRHAELLRYIFRFNGLCELISNYIIMEDLMGRAQNGLENFDQSSYKAVRINDSTLELANNNLYQEKITLFNLSQPRVRNSHILDVCSFWQKIIAFLFGVYPCSLFSFLEPVQTSDRKINQELLKSKLDALPDNFYIKFMIFNKDIFGFKGHSMVIKKTGDAFSFFDPNKGEETNLDFEELCTQINGAIDKHNAESIAFLDAEKFISELVNVSQTELSIFR